MVISSTGAIHIAVAPRVTLWHTRGMERVAVLLDIRSAHNVGAMFRTADGVGMTAMHLVGITPAPTDRFGRPDARIAKVALGAERALPWHSHTDWRSAHATLKAKGFTIVALEQAPEAESLFSFTPPEEPWALLVGSETDGIPREVLDTVDVVVEVPMRGVKESLNVASAFAVAAYALTR